ncbi:hypothetical protein L1987_78802 [Smallanthus sonchifolius]|uniref:Uncharacterized protein n=1 Tax=Smallanthus sonchifolius TaxID=185202 RepID=A0ACB8ZI55_9ASTR|nr:hypothetical protein L1987_78802 [Smallanthus sonchifolius]
MSSVIGMIRESFWDVVGFIELLFSVNQAKLRVVDVEVADGGSEVEHLDLEESGKSGAALLKEKGIEGASPEKSGRKRKGHALLRTMSPGGQKSLVDEFFQWRSDGGSNEKKDTKNAGVVDLEEPEVPFKRIKTLREREAEMHEGIKKIKDEGRDTMKVHTAVGINKSGGEKDGVLKEKVLLRFM